MKLIVRYDMPDENSETRRQRHAKFGQPAPPKADPPREAIHVWDWFWTLSSRRRSGPEPLDYAEIAHWSQLTATPLRPHEVEMITRMDDAYLSEIRKEQAAAIERMKEK